MQSGLRALTLLGMLLSGAALPAASTAQAAAPAATPRCHTGTLYVAEVPQSAQGGVGHIGFVLSVRSFAQHACYVDGYPGIQLIDGQGRNLPTHVRWGAGYLFGNPPKHLVTLKTGATAYFKMEWVHIPTGNEPCPVATNLLVTPPDERVSVVVPTSSIDACGGRVTVTPMLASAS